MRVAAKEDGDIHAIQSLGGCAEVLKKKRIGRGGIGRVNRSEKFPGPEVGVKKALGCLVVGRVEG